MNATPISDRTHLRFECASGHAFNVEGERTVIKTRDRFGDRTPNRDYVIYEHGFEHACPTCGADARRAFRKGKVVAFNGTHSDRQCGPACEKATSAECKCVCGGMAHGIAS